MFDKANGLEHLRTSVQTITKQWFEHRGPWLGISEEKIAQTKLPEPLRWIYRFAGEWPSDNWWETVFAYQDMLLPFESLSIKDGKLVFVVENQGCWDVGTDTSGEDPPVWVRENEDHAPWQKLCDSLTEFLVTFCLHEVVFGSRYRTHVENILGRFEKLGCHISPLWLDAPYVYLFDDIVSRPISFHMVDGRFLVMDNAWCGTSVDEPWRQFPELFKVPEEQPRSIEGHLPFPADIEIPDFVRKSHIQNLIRRHQRQADYHQGMISKYEQMLQKMDGS